MIALLGAGGGGGAVAAVPLRVTLNGFSSPSLLSNESVPTAVPLLAARN
jgi:hypothetical protein